MKRAVEIIQAVERPEVALIILNTSKNFVALYGPKITTHTQTDIHTHTHTDTNTYALTDTDACLHTPNNDTLVESQEVSDEDSHHAILRIDFNPYS